ISPAPAGSSASSCAASIPVRRSWRSSKRSSSSASALHGAATKASPCRSTVRSFGPPRSGRRAGLPCRWTSASKTRTTLSPISNPAVRDSGRLDADLLRLEVAALAHDEIEIAQVHEHAERLAGDEHGVAPIERVGEQQQTAGDREEPEGDRNHAAALPFACDPLHEETAGEHQLRNKAEDHPPIEIGDKDVEEVAPDHPLQINQHPKFPP